MATTSLSKWIKRVRAAERSGDLLVAHDLANRGLADHPGSVDLQYLATRVLARSGACTQAAALYEKFGLDRERNLDIAALGARIAKDNALNASTGRSEALATAAAKYAKLYLRSRDHYPAINAATLYLLAGNQFRARLYAGHALKAARSARYRDSLEAYYLAATQAEAALVRGDLVAGREALQQAAKHLGKNFDAAATTRKQLRLVCQAARLKPDILDILRVPAAMHYHGPSPSFAADFRGRGSLSNRAIASDVAKLLRDWNVGYVYGSLTAGREIICAETALSAGAELHVVLPFNQEEFVETNVRIAGSRWVRRFESCLKRAKSVTLATSDSFQGDRQLFTYACRLGMGMTALRAGYLDGKVLHLKLQPARSDPDPVGYDMNIKLWEAPGRPLHVLAQRPASGAATRRTRNLRSAVRAPPRFSRALLFGDVKGFSKIPDRLVLTFQRRLMGAIAKVLGRYGRHVLYRNSWGDAIYAVIDDPVVAADCCLAMQDAVTKANPSRYGLPAELSLRLAAHFGPVYEGHDPVRDETNFYGAHATMTARMEPVTAPGQVYVTEAMAASIAMAIAPQFRAETVGIVPMAKGYGSMRMYRLARVVRLK